MSLYQSSVLNKYLAAQDAEQLAKAFEKYTNYFLNKEIQENIRNTKEEQFQQKFLIELFVNVLGYVMNPEKLHTTLARQSKCRIRIRQKSLAISNLLISFAFRMN